MTDWHLRKHPDFVGVPGPVLIVVMDGVGCGAQDDGDAVWLAKTPTLDALSAAPLSTKLRAHGLAVGLPSDDDMGNSEVGHNAFGAGRVFDQGATRVQAAIENGRSRVYIGIHWDFDDFMGREAGVEVANYVASNAFQPIPEPSSGVPMGLGLLAIGGLARQRRPRRDLRTDR